MQKEGPALGAPPRALGEVPAQVEEDEDQEPIICIISSLLVLFCYYHHY